MVGEQPLPSSPCTSEAKAQLKWVPRGIRPLSQRAQNLGRWCDKGTLGNMEVSCSEGAQAAKLELYTGPH